MTESRPPPRAPLVGISARLAHMLLTPRDAAALAAFRVGLGLLVTISAARFLAYGWIDRFFVKPALHFKYWGFSWVPALPAPYMHLVFVALSVLGLAIAAGAFYRIAAPLAFVAFTYVQLVDVATYLNHYYLVSLLLGLMSVVPAHRCWSVDAWRRPALRSDTLPAWCTYLLRFQVAVVYVNAGLAKLTTDWLLHAQPLAIWLAARPDLPIVGPLLEHRLAAYVAAWFGFLFDTTIVAFLMWRRARPFAYAVVVLFHLATWVLFPIGMFPFIMMLAALVFFDSSWPRRFVPRARPVVEPPPPAPGRGARAACAIAVIYGVVQIGVPLRAHLYGGNVLWHEQGMRFSWRVMAREKNGSVTFYVRQPATNRAWIVSPREWLTDLQEREMSVQPDLIAQLAQRIARDAEARGGGPVEVRAEAKVSLNGRPSSDLVDPTVDLARVHVGLAPLAFIRPAPPALVSRRP